MKRIWLWGLLGLIVFGTLGTGLLLVGRARARPDQTAPQLPPPPSPKEEALSRIRIAVTSGLGMPPQNVELKEATETGQGWDISVEGKSKDAQVMTTLNDAQKVFSEIQRTGVDIAKATLLLRTDKLMDVYGRPLKDEPLMKVILSRDSFEKIKWSSFDPLNFPDVAQEFWLNSKLQEEFDKLKQKQQQSPTSQQGATGQSPGAGGGGGGSGGGS